MIAYYLLSSRSDFVEIQTTKMSFYSRISRRHTVFVEWPVLPGRLQEFERPSPAGTAIGQVVGQSGRGAAQLHPGEFVGQCKAAREPADRGSLEQIANQTDEQPSGQGAEFGEEVGRRQRPGPERLQSIRQDGPERSEQVLADGGHPQFPQGDDLECWRIFQRLQVQIGIGFN